MKNYRFWLKSAMVLQLITAVVHGSSLFIKPSPQNETEKQLLDLMATYRPDAGAGFAPSAADLFLALSACFTLLYLFGGLLTWYLSRQHIPLSVWGGILNISIFVFGVCFALMAWYTFLPPILLTGIVLLLLIITRILLPVRAGAEA